MFGEVVPDFEYPLRRGLERIVGVSERRVDYSFDVGLHPLGGVESECTGHHMFVVRVL